MRDQDDEVKPKGKKSSFTINGDRDLIPEQENLNTYYPKERNKFYKDPNHDLRIPAREHFRADNTLEENIKLLKNEIQNLKKNYMQVNRGVEPLKTVSFPAGKPLERPVSHGEDVGAIMTVNLKRGPNDGRLIQLLTKSIENMENPTNLEIDNEKIRISIPIKELKRNPELLALINKSGPEESAKVPSKQDLNKEENFVPRKEKKQQNSGPAIVTRKPSSSTYTDIAKRKKSPIFQKPDDKINPFETNAKEEDPEGRFPVRDNYISKENGFAPYFQSKRNSIDKIAGLVEYPRQKNYKVPKPSEKSSTEQETVHIPPQKSLAFQKLNAFPGLRDQKSADEFSKTPPKEHISKDPYLRREEPRESLVKSEKPKVFYMEDKEVNQDRKPPVNLRKNYQSPYAEVRKNEELITDLKRNIVRMYSPDERGGDKEDGKRDYFPVSASKQGNIKPHEGRGSMLLQELSELYKQSLGKMQEIKDSLKAWQTKENRDYPLKIVIEGNFRELQKKEEKMLSVLSLLEDEEDPSIVIPAQTMQTNMLMFREIMDALEDKIFQKGQPGRRTNSTSSHGASYEISKFLNSEKKNTEGSYKPPRDSSRLDEEKMKMARQIEMLQEKVRHLEKFESNEAKSKEKMRDMPVAREQRGTKDAFEKNFIEKIAERVNRRSSEDDPKAELLGNKGLQRGNSMAYNKIRREESPSPEGINIEGANRGSNSSSKHDLARNNFNERSGEGMKKPQRIQQQSSENAQSEGDYRANSEKVANRLNRLMMVESRVLNEGSRNNDESEIFNTENKRLEKYPSFGDEND